MYSPAVASAPQAFYNTTPGSSEVNAHGVPFGFFHHPLPGILPANAAAVASV
jgi:hypothetical protein